MNAGAIRPARPGPRRPAGRLLRALALGLALAVGGPACAGGEAAGAQPARAGDLEQAMDTTSQLLGRALACGLDNVSVALYRDRARAALLALAADEAARSKVESMLFIATLVGMDLAKQGSAGREVACEPVRDELIERLRGDREAMADGAPVGDEEDAATRLLEREMLSASIAILSPATPGPARTQAYATRSRLLRASGVAAAAAEDAAQVVRASPDEDLGYLLRGMALADLGDAHHAVEDLNRALDRGADPAQAWLHLGRAREQLGLRYLALRDYGRGLARAPEDEALREREWRGRALAAPAARIALHAEEARVVEGRSFGWLMVTAPPWVGGSEVQLARLAGEAGRLRRLYEMLLERARSREAVFLHLGDLADAASASAKQGIPTRFEVLALDARLHESAEFMGEVGAGDTDERVMAAIGRQFFREIVSPAFPELESASISVDSRLFVTGGQPARRIRLKGDLAPGLSVQYVFHIVTRPPDHALLFVLQTDSKLFDARYDEFERMLQTVAIRP